VLSGKSIAQVKQLNRVADLDAILTMTQTAVGQSKARALIAKHKGPTYSTDPERPDVIIERLPDGTSRSGKFINRQFVAIAAKTRGAHKVRTKKSTRRKSAVVAS
jgi:hypothetical protein